MHVHINHMYCFDSCWSGGTYWCRYSVSVERHNGKSFCDVLEDWNNLTEEFQFFDMEEYTKLLTFDSTKDMSDEDIRRWATKKAFRLRPEIIDWLNENVKDRRDKEQPKGWCCGSDSYVARDWNGISLFFERRKDALAFIKRWSVHKQPTTYFDYFREIRKELKDGKLVKVEKYSD